MVGPVSDGEAIQRLRPSRPLSMPVFHSHLKKTRIKSGETACKDVLLM